MSILWAKQDPFQDGSLHLWKVDRQNTVHKKPRTICKKLLFLFRDSILSDLEAIAPVFIFIGLICIGTYLLPTFLGKLDDWKKEEIERKL